MDIKSIIKSIVEKKLEKDSDDPCWDGYVQLGTKKKGGKEVPNCVPKESVELDEAKADVYHKHMLKALGKTRLPKNHSYTSMIADNGDFIVRDGAGRVAGRIPKAEHDLKESLPPHLQKHFDGKGKKIDGKWVTKNGKKTWVADKKKGNFTSTDVTPKGYGPNESTELTEDAHDALNDIIIEFQRKLMKMSEHLDPSIAEEVAKLDESLDDLRAGSLFKSRSER